MDGYVRRRMMADAGRVLRMGRDQDALEHQGLKGRFREILLNDMIQPWVPPVVVCATGTVVGSANYFRSKTQEESLSSTRSVSAPAFLSAAGGEGVFTRNSILARVEVKSTANGNEFSNFVESCEEFTALRIDLPIEKVEGWCKAGGTKHHNFFFGYKVAAATQKSTIEKWLNAVTDGLVTLVCIPEHGLWHLRPDEGWQEYECQTDEFANERTAAFTALLSDVAVQQHLDFNGFGKLPSSVVGIGIYFFGGQSPAWKGLKPSNRKARNEL
jgi:hypothetical protein